MSEHAQSYLVYSGSYDPDDGECSIQVRDLATDGSGWALNPRFDLRRHSPDGFSWGYHGSGCAQTALAIMASHLAEPKHHVAVMAVLGMHEQPSEDDLDGQELGDYLAERYYQKFKARVIAGIAQNTDWELTEEAIEQLIVETDTRAQVIA